MKRYFMHFKRSDGIETVDPEMIRRDHFLRATVKDFERENKGRWLTPSEALAYQLGARPEDFPIEAPKEDAP